MLLSYYDTMEMSRLCARPSPLDAFELALLSYDTMEMSRLRTAGMAASTVDMMPTME